MAEEDIRRLSVAAAAGSEKGFKEANESLRREMGDIYRKTQFEEIRAGLAELKQLSQGMSRG